MASDRLVSEAGISERKDGGNWLAGVVLVGIGAVLLAVQVLQIDAVGALAPIAIGLGLIAAWLRSDEIGYLIPAAS